MTTRSSSSSDSETEEITQGVRAGTTGTNQTTGSIYRAASSTASQNSAVPTGTPYDTVSIATTNTGFTSATNFTGNTSVSRQATLGGGIPIIRPPALQSQENLASAVNQPIRVDVASAQQRTVQSQISPYSNSSVTSSSASLSSPGSASLQQPRFDAAKAMFQQVDTNRDGSISRDEFRQWAQGGQQAQFANHYSGQQQFNQLLGTASYNDSSLHIDYGAIEAYNFGLQSAGDITAEQFTKGFDAAKAIFRQVDTNRDGSISRDEFRQWAQGGQQNFGGQTHNNYGTNYQQTQSYGNTNPEIASILQQSGLGQGYANYR